MPGSPYHASAFRVACIPTGVGARSTSADIGNTVDDVPEVNLSLAHTAEASSVLGTLMRLCIYVATGSQTHGRNFQVVARQCGLAPLEGKWATAGYPDATAIPSWVREVLDQLGPWPAPRLQVEHRKKRQPSRWVTVLCEKCACRWKSTALHLAEATIRCPHEGCDGEQVIQLPHDMDSTPDGQAPGVTFTSAKHPGKSCTRPTWFVGRVISARQARRVFNALCGLPDCGCRHFARSGASLAEVTDSAPGLGRQFVVRQASVDTQKRPVCPAGHTTPHDQLRVMTSASQRSTVAPGVAGVGAATRLTYYAWSSGVPSTGDQGGDHA